MPGLKIVLTGDGTQVEHFQILCHSHDDLVNIGQLVPLCIHHVKIGIALEDPCRSINWASRLPGRDGRQFGIDRPIVFEFQEAHPVVKPCRLDELVYSLFAYILRQKLLQVVLGSKAAQEITSLKAMPPEPCNPSEDVHKSIVWIFKDEPEGGVIDLDHLAWLA